MAATIAVFLVATSFVNYKRKRQFDVILDRSKWILQQQCVAINNEKIKVETRLCKFEYSWEVFSESYEDERGIILGSGPEPVVFIPSTADIPKSSIDRIRDRFK